MKNILKTFRIAGGFTQYELLQRLRLKGICRSQAMYSLWERGYLEPPIEVKKALAQILGIKPILLENNLENNKETEGAREK